MPLEPCCSTGVPGVANIKHFGRREMGERKEEEKEEEKGDVERRKEKKGESLTHSFSVSVILNQG